MAIPDAPDTLPTPPATLDLSNQNAILVAIYCVLLLLHEDLQELIAAQP